MPRSVSSSHFKRLGCPVTLSAQRPELILACATFDRLRQSTALHDTTPIILGMDTMGSLLVRGCTGLNLLLPYTPNEFLDLGFLLVINDAQLIIIPTEGCQLSMGYSLPLDHFS